MNGFNRILVSGLFMLFLLHVSFAETTCTKGDCEVTITLKIAFQGANNTYINNAKNEIESVWGGPNGYRTFGDCKCKMKFEVKTTTAQDCKNNPPAGYHCIMVTDYNNNPPRNQTNWTGAKFYIGYMYGVASGNGNNSEKGWWSSIMSRPVNASNPQGEHYKDFAHEAGHMMGLEDGDGGIMNQTSGANSGPTQANIDEIANDICGADACPDRCCCGNGQVDKDKGEECDPKVAPTGCDVGQTCCPVCCSCYGPICIPSDGEYMSQADCQNRCGADSACYYNYKTGCWDCLKQTVVIHETCYDSENIRGNLDCDHQPRTFVEQGKSFYNNDLADTPFLGGVFANERINIKTEEGEEGYLITQETSVTGYGEALLTDPTVTIYSDSETIGLIASEDMSVQQAISSGRIDIQGEGIVEGFKFGFYHLLFDVYNLFSPAPEFVQPVPEEDYPQEYYDEMDAIAAAGPAPENPGPMDPERLPDGGYIGEDVFPE